MAGQALFRGFGPVSVACTGVLALCIGGAQAGFPEIFCADQFQFLQVWITVTVVASVFIIAHMCYRAKMLHGTQCGALLNRIFEQLVPPVCATLSLTWAFTQYAQSQINALPGIWLMMASLACFSMAVSLGSKMRFVGSWYLVCGTAVLVVGLKQPLVVLSPWLLAIPFFAGQLGMALVLRIESSTDHSPGHYVEGQDS